MNFTVYSLSDNGIDKVTAHNWMNCMSLKTSPRHTQVRVPTVSHGKLTDMYLFVRCFHVDTVIAMAQDMIDKKRTTTNVDKWKTILMIALNIKGKHNV